MSQAGYTPIQLYFSTTASAVPTNTNLANGELAINITDGKLYYKDNTGTVKLLAGTGGAGIAAGSNTQIQFNSSGSFGASSSLTFDGTTFSAPNSVITSSSSSAALRITQTGSADSLLVEDSANPDSTPFVINSGGQTTVGYTSQPFFISGVVPLFGVVGTGNTTSVASVATYSADSNPAWLLLGKSRGAIGSQGIVSSGDSVGIIDFSGSDGVIQTPLARITGAVDGTPGTNDMPGRLVFSTTADGASTPTERMRIDSAGQVGIGSSTLTGYNLRLGKNITGATTSIALDVTGTIQSDVTTNGSGFRTQLSTQATAFTLGSLVHYQANQITIGAGSTVTNQYGYIAQSTLTGATNNYGFYSNIASGTGRWNFYAAGTADNYLGGKLGLGTTVLSVYGVRNALPITGGTTAIGYDLSSTVQSDVTALAVGYRTLISTAASAFTASNIYHFQAAQNTIGAGSTVTTQYGFVVDSNMTGATVNLGFYGAIASGTGRYNLYMAGTAANYIEGNVGIGTNAPGSKLDVKGTLRLSGATSGYVGLAPAAAAGSTTYTLPSADGTSGQFLSTNGSGTLSWATGGGGGGSAATPTSLGTVYASMSTSGAAPYLTAVGYLAGNSNTSSGIANSAFGWGALNANTTGIDNTSLGMQTMNVSTTGSANTAVGKKALQANTTASNNTAVGFESLNFNTTASNNTAVGYQAAYSNTTGTGITAVGTSALLTSTGSDNNAFGRDVLRQNTTGYSNSAFGGAANFVASAMAYNTTGYNNCAFGNGALAGNTTAANNVAVGHTALYSNSTGGSHVAVGQGALQANTTASGNTAIGYETAYTNTTGVQITALGYRAAKAGTTANYITAIGYAALLSNTTGGDNVAVGASAMELNTTGGDNTAVGDAALYANTTGAQNVSVGRNAGNSITTGSQNVCVGFDTDASAAGGLGQITIGYGLTGQGNYHVTMGTSSSKIYVNYTSTGTWTQTSDATLKNVIGQETLGLSFINRLNPVTFTWKSQTDLPVNHPHYSTTNKKNVTTVMHGLLAQDVKAAMDAEGCATFNGWDVGDDGVQAVSREMFVTPLIKAIQELTAQVETLKARLNAANL